MTDRASRADRGAGNGGTPGHARSSGATGAGRQRRVASWLARLNALFGIVLVLAAVRLARGG